MVEFLQAFTLTSCLALTAHAVSTAERMFAMTTDIRGCPEATWCMPGVDVPDPASGRRALLVSDNPAAPLFTFGGAPLHVTAGDWLAARGTLTIGLPIVPPDNTERMHAEFSGLIPGGVYSLFTYHYGPIPGHDAIGNGTSISASDSGGMGRANSFTADADGNGRIDAVYADLSSYGFRSWIELVYNFHGISGGTMPSKLGYSSAPQLIWIDPTVPTSPSSG